MGTQPVNVVVVAWAEGRLEAQAHERAVAAAVAAGHHVRDIDLVAEGYGAAMTPAEREAYHDLDPLVTEVVRRHVDAVREADAIVFIYPTTATTLPATLKGWLERTMLPGVAFVFDERSGRVKPGLRRVGHIVGIATYTESRAAVLARTDNGRRILQRALRLNTGLRTTTHWVGCYRADRASPERQEHFLDRAAQALANL